MCVCVWPGLAACKTHTARCANWTHVLRFFSKAPLPHSPRAGGRRPGAERRLRLGPPCVRGGGCVWKTRAGPLNKSGRFCVSRKKTSSPTHSHARPLFALSGGGRERHGKVALLLCFSLSRPHDRPPSRRRGPPHAGAQRGRRRAWPHPHHHLRRGRHPAALRVCAGGRGWWGEGGAGGGARDGRGE